MPYVRERTKIRLPSWRRLTRNVRVFLAIAVLSLVAGFLATMIGNKVNESRSVTLETLVAEQKQKAIDGFKEKYGDNWKEKVLAEYKKNQ